MLDRKALYSVLYQILYQCLQDCSWVSSIPNSLTGSCFQFCTSTQVFRKESSSDFFQDQWIPKQWFHTPAYWSVISKNVFLQSEKWGTMLDVQQPELQLNNGKCSSSSSWQGMLCVMTYKKCTIHDQLPAMGT